MTQAEYDTWAERHALLFGVTAEANIRMLDAWWQVLGDYDSAELHAATDRLLAGDYPSFATDHLKALQALLRLARAEAYAAAKSELRGRPDVGTCTLCDGSGHVIVPHPRCVTNGEYHPISLCRGGASYYTCAVWCHCPLGRWGSGRDTMGRLTLEEYERRVNPRWRTQLALRDRVTAAALALDSPPSDGPKAAESWRRLDDILRGVNFSPRVNGNQTKN